MQISWLTGVYCFTVSQNLDCGCEWRLWPLWSRWLYSKTLSESVKEQNQRLGSVMHFHERFIQTLFVYRESRYKNLLKLLVSDEDRLLICSETLKRTTDASECYRQGDIQRILRGQSVRDLPVLIMEMKPHTIRWYLWWSCHWYSVKIACRLRVNILVCYW